MLSLVKGWAKGKFSLCGELADGTLVVHQMIDKAPAPGDDGSMWDMLSNAQLNECLVLWCWCRLLYVFAKGNVEMQRYTRKL